MDDKKNYYDYAKGWSEVDRITREESEKSWLEKHPTAFSYLVIGGTLAVCVIATIGSVELFAAATARRVVSRLKG